MYTFWRDREFWKLCFVPFVDLYEEHKMKQTFLFCFAENLYTCPFTWKTIWCNVRNLFLCTVWVCLVPDILPGSEDIHHTTCWYTIPYWGHIEDRPHPILWPYWWDWGSTHSLLCAQSLIMTLLGRASMAYYDHTKSRHHLLAILTIECHPSLSHYWR